MCIVIVVVMVLMLVVSLLSYVVNRSNIVGCQLSQIFFSVVVGFFSNDFVFFIFMIWCFQVEYVDN